MSEAYIVWVLFGGLGITLLMGIPVGYALGIATTLALLLTKIPLVYMAQTLYTGVGLFPLIAIPGFILAGQLMERSKLTNRIIDIINVSIGNIPGGLAVVTIVACMFFASLTGSGPATTAAIGGIMIPAMIRAGYPVPFAAAVAAVGGTLGILIPPSNPMIIYAVVANVSVAGLFLSGVLPGLLLATGLATYCFAIGRIRSYRATGISFNITAFLKALWLGKYAMLMPVIVLGSIYGGFATPTEASMLAVVYSGGYGLLARKFNYQVIFESMISTGRLTGAVLIIMGPATAFGKLLTLYQIPNQISDAITSFSTNPLIVLLLIGVFLVLVGMFMETLSTIVLLTPVFLPALLLLGVDPVQFGILFVVLSEVGFLTPPLGVNLYVASALTDTSVEKVSVAVLPFVGVLLAFCVILILFPWLSTIGYQMFTGR